VKATHGGTRPGAGRKTADNVKVERHTVTLDVRTAQVMREEGEGNLSQGIRAAARVLIGRDDKGGKTP
jgi:hypothetical protein